MKTNDSQDQPRKPSSRPTGRGTRRRKEDIALKMTVMVPKHPNADPNDKDDWRELGPNEPFPECVSNNIIKHFAPLVVDVLNQFHLKVDDFDDETWGPFVQSCIGHKFGLADDTERLREVLKTVLERKLERLKTGAANPRRGRKGAPKS